MRAYLPRTYVLLLWASLITTGWGQPCNARAQEQSTELQKGEVLEFTFDQSKIFPGTTRQVWVYVPRQYQPESPACVYVNQDGIQFGAPDVFDQLISAGEMPITVGVFVMHGKVPAANPDALDRFNRSFEYDGLGDNYARFLLEELLPFVETKRTSDGRQIVLSKSGNDRAIGGVSSGAICAFTTAWERPEAFSRVFSGIGTYVGLRGGQDYSTLIRKYEPKPIRIFMEDGSGDLNIYGGDWWMANQAMERSFTFAGYEVTHVWGEGGHDVKQSTLVFPDAMRFLWKDWPKPVAAGPGSAQLQEILIPNENWELVGEGYRFTEGPAANAQGMVFFNDVPTSETFQVAAEGPPQVVQTATNLGNGQAFGPGDLRYCVEGGLKQIAAYATDGTRRIIAEEIAGNDLTVRHDGSVYVTEPDWNGNGPSKIWYISASGEKRVVDEGLKFANGITLSPDQTLLLVADYRSHWVYSFQIAADGSLQHKQKYFHLHKPDTADDSGADGLRTDRAGRLYVASRLGIQVCDQAGRVNCIIPTPNKAVSNLCFGGPEFDVLYATCNDKVYRRKVKVQGANGFEPPIKPNAPRL